MKILIACESSGIVRDAFIAKGHDAWSCDILDSDTPWPCQHIKRDISEVLKWGWEWDMLIAHPPCTDLACSGARYFAEKKADGRQQKSVEFFMAMINAPIKKIAVENPIGIMSSIYRKPDQIIQPWQFGHAESKATCLWLKGLPILLPTKIVLKPEKGYWENQTPSGQNKLGPSPDRWKIRSATYPGIAAAMAEQWG
ncbi:MAG: DNA cytosine methyltransferase [Phycisphaerae bacterium]|jgi:hypothetical protein